MEGKPEPGTCYLLCPVSNKIRRQVKKQESKTQTPKKKKAQELPESTVLTAPLGQLWSQDCYPPESDFILHHHNILGDCVLKQ